MNNHKPTEKNKMNKEVVECYDFDGEYFWCKACCHGHLADIFEYEFIINKETTE